MMGSPVLLLIPHPFLTFRYENVRILLTSNKLTGEDDSSDSQCSKHPCNSSFSRYGFKVDCYLNQHVKEIIDCFTIKN